MSLTNIRNKMFQQYKKYGNERIDDINNEITRSNDEYDDVEDQIRTLQHIQRDITNKKIRLTATLFATIIDNCVNWFRNESAKETLTQNDQNMFEIELTQQIANIIAYIIDYCILPNSTPGVKTCEEYRQLLSEYCNTIGSKDKLILSLKMYKDITPLTIFNKESDNQLKVTSVKLDLDEFPYEIIRYSLNHVFPPKKNIDMDSGATINETYNLIDFNNANRYYYIVIDHIDLTYKISMTTVISTK